MSLRLKAFKLCLSSANLGITECTLCCLKQQMCQFTLTPYSVQISRWYGGQKPGWTKGLHCQCQYEIQLADCYLEVPHRWWYWGQDCFTSSLTAWRTGQKERLDSVMLGGVVNALECGTAIQIGQLNSKLQVQLRQMHSRLNNPYTSTQMGANWL